MRRQALCALLCGACATIFAKDTVLTDWEFRKEGETAWRKVSVPHDWAIEATPIRGLCPHQGDLPFAGKGFYRRALDGFTPPAGGRVYLDFDGVMCRSAIFLNGTKVGGTPFGYTSEVIDVTDALKADGNLLEVTAENVPSSSRWYPGSGVFREVTVRVVPRDHVKPRTLFVRTLDANERHATVAVSFEWTGGTSNYTFTVANPRLWSPETPHLYTLELFGEKFRYGIRTAVFDPQKGFFLNGRHRQMRGVCLHHDLGPIGARFDRTFARRQLALLKEMGCDAIRTSHNPPAAALLDLCDEMGVFVMDEAFDMWERPKGDYAKFFKEWHERDLTELVRRDRSHPSVVMWSIGNELSEFNNPDGKDAIRIATALTAIVKREDATRPVTFGSWKPEPMDNGCQDTVDAFGANYLPFRYAAFSAKHPTVGLVGTETCSTVSSRGEYFFPVVASPIASEKDLARRRNEGRERMVRGAQMSGYDLWGPHPNDYPPDVEFEYQEKNPQVYGEFVWTGFDYIGEPDPCAKSGGRLSYFGIFDLCGFAKDRYWLYKAQWRPDVPSAHILPHWNWSPATTTNLPVHVYTSGDEAELFVNGVSQGRKTRGRYQYRFVWENVTYAPGAVSVKTWKKGQPWAEDRIVTAGEPAQVVVEEERGFPGFYRLKAVDEKGNFCPTAKRPVELTLTGDWRVIAVGNGDASDHAPSLGTTRVNLFNGLALAVVEKRGTGSFAAAFPAPRRELRGARVLKPLPAGAVKPRGWLADEARRAAKGYVGQLDAIPGARGDRFREAWSPAHPKTGADLYWVGGTGISFEIGGYWFDGLVRLARALEDPTLLRKARNRIDGVVSHMNDDAWGFFWWLKRKDGSLKDHLSKCGENHWVLASGYGGFARALSAWHAANPTPAYARALAAAYDCDDLLLTGGWSGIAPQAAVLAWEETGDAGVAARLDTFFGKIAAGTHPHDILTAPPADEPQPAKRRHPGHGVTRVENLTGTLFGYFWTGARRYLDNVKTWVNYLDELALQPNGAWAADEYFRPGGAYTGTEACTIAAEEWLFLNLLSAEGAGCWGDRVESLFYNAGLRVTDRDYAKHTVMVRPNTPDPQPYKALASVGCCSANLTRILPIFIQHLWMATSDGGLAATVYAPSSVSVTVADGVAARIVSETRYPCSDTIDLSLELARDAAFPLKLRIPSWCPEPTVAINGSVGKVAIENGFACLRRTWRNGDRVTLRLPYAPVVRAFETCTDPSRHFGAFWWKGCDYNTQEWLGDQSAACRRTGAWVEAGPLCFALPAESGDWQRCVTVGAKPSIEYLEKGDWPVRVTVAGCKAAWHHDPKHPGLPRPDQVRAGAACTLELVPYGSLIRAVSVFPVRAEETREGAK